MPYRDSNSASSLMVVIVNHGKGSKVLDFLLQLGIRGATAILAHGTAPGSVLKILEIADVRKEVILVALPAHTEKETINKLIARFHFDRPNMGVVFTVGLSAVLGSRHFSGPAIPMGDRSERSELQAVLAVVNKGQAESVLDCIEEQGLPRGIIIEAHGAANQTKRFFNLVLETEKDIILTVTTRSQTCRLTSLLTECLALNTPDSGILTVLNLQRAAGITLTLRLGLDDCDSQLSENKAGHSAIFAIVEKGREGAVVQSAEAAGATGGTIMHARGSAAYHSKSFLTHGVEEARAVVMTVVPDTRVSEVSQRIRADLQLDQPGKGILFIMPLYDTEGIAPASSE